MSLDEIWRFRDRVVSRMDLNCRFPPNSHVQLRKFDPWLLFESRSLIWHPNVRVVSFGPSSSFPKSLLPPRFQPSWSHLLLSSSRTKALSRYAFNTLFPKHLFPWQSFRISFVSRATALATACLCVPPEFIRPTPFRTRHGSLVSFCLSLSFFFVFFYVYFFHITLSKFFSLQYSLKFIRMACNIKFDQYTRTK